MNLQPSQDEPGLWVNRDWAEGQPGLFAVVIGVSAYPHLAPDEPPAPGAAPPPRPGESTYGLGQLKVSAYTARRIFEWLRDEYRIDGCPLARCWLLLSPRPGELAFRPEISEHLTAPTFENCKKAIRFWRASMRKLPKQSAIRSRSLFFFSGHGLEVHTSKQVLLPSDYLAPPEPSWNDAISTANLQAGLASTPVARQFFFIDACRNDHRELRSKQVKGAEILSEDEAAAACPEIVATPVLYATDTGERAYQPQDPGRGPSLYGQALLEGLQGQPDLALERVGQDLSVRMYALDAFVKERVVQLIAAAQEDVNMPVVFAGTKISNEHVTLLDAAPAANVASPPPLPPPPHPSVLVAEGMPDPDPRTLRVEFALSRVAPRAEVFSGGMPRHVWAQSYSVGHQIFGSESITEVWSKGLRLFGLGTGAWIDDEALVLHRVDRDDRTRRFRVELTVERQDAIGHWLQLTDGSGRLHGCLLPDDAYHRPRYSIEFDVLFREESGGSGRRFTRLDAHLSREDPEPGLRAVADLWMRLRAGDVGGAVGAFEESAVGYQLMEIGDWMTEIRTSNPDLSRDDLAHLVSDVRGKVESPLTATVASLLLFRTGRLDLVKDWVRNLADWFPFRTDGAVLWAEQVMRQEPDRGRAVGEAAEYLMRLLDHGLPHTNEAMGYAATLTDRLLAARRSLPGDRVDALTELRSRIDGALVHFRPGGLFASYTAYDANVSPLELLGIRRSRPRAGPSSSGGLRAVAT